MAGVELSAVSYLFSTDIGICQTRVATIQGYDVEDIVRNRAISQARAIQLASLGKRIYPQMPTTPRTIKSVWLNNDEELPS